MRKIYYFFIFLPFLFITSMLASETHILSLAHIRMTMEKMFTYHVEVKEFSPLIVKRSFKIYLEQFDPERIYLLKAEVEPFLELSIEQIRQIIRHYKQDTYPEYRALNQTIEGAIYRNEQIRQELEARLLEEGEAALNKSPPQFYYSYPSSEKELRERIYERLILEVKGSLQDRLEQEVTPELIQKILKYRTKRGSVFNRRYLNESEHYLALHILKALAKSLDAHTGYYSPREAFEIRTNLKKEFSGVGIMLQEDFDGIYISGLISRGPAERSGLIQVGDILAAINLRDVETLTFEDLSELLKGKTGSKVTLTVKRQNKLIHVDLIREKIVMDNERLTITHEPFGDGIIGKINVPAFYDNGGQVNLAHDCREALRMLKAEGNLKGVIMDFRENSGGFLTQAVKVASLFINGGLVVISKYADDKVNYARSVDGRQYYNGPLVILISKASASAAEIVAQALQDYGVAIIVGDERSYGKGSMQYQTITDEHARAFFKVTVGRYYTASGRSPQIHGVRADIVVPTKFFPYNIGEKYLEFPLSNDHLSNELFHSLMNIKQGPYREVARLAVPYLKPRESEWRQLLPELIINSKKRLEKNQNFQFFLKVGKDYQPQKSKGEQRSIGYENYGVEDLQVQEAVEIIKDMILLSQEKHLRENLLKS